MSELDNQSKSKAKDILLRIIRNDEAARVLILLAMIGVFRGIIGPRFFDPQNIFNVIIQSMQRGAAAIGVGIVIIGGGIDISMTGISLLGGAITAKMITAGSLGRPGLAEGFFANPLPLVVGILVFLLVGLGWGYLNGKIITRTGADPLIPTLATGMIASGIALALIMPRSNVGNFPPSVTLLASGSTAGVPNPVILFISVVAITYFLMTRTTFGKRVYAVGGNPVAAWLSGIDVNRVRITTYVISGFLAALSGVVLLSRTENFAMMLTGPLAIDSLTAALIGGARLGGGKGSIIGIAIGVIMLGLIGNGMNLARVDPSFQPIVKGVIIAVAVAIDYWRMRPS